MPSIEETQIRMGWSDETLLELIEQFLLENKIYEDACEFVKTVADKEDEECQESE